MKKKIVLLSSLLLTAGTITSSLILLGNENFSVKAQFEDQQSHQIILTAEDSSVEGEDLYTHYSNYIKMTPH